MTSTVNMNEAYENQEESVDANEPAPLGYEIVSWETPEYLKHERAHWWYWLYGIAIACMLIYAVVTSNFLFAVILIIGTLTLIISDARHPEPIIVVITTEGVVVGNRFYDYDEMRHFTIIYKPMHDVRRVYFEFKSAIKHRLSLPLHDVDPIIVRDNLLKYIPEDLERDEEPLSEVLGRLLKL